MQWKVKDYVFVCKYKHKRAMHDPETNFLSNEDAYLSEKAVWCPREISVHPTSPVLTWQRGHLEQRGTCLWINSRKAPQRRYLFQISPNVPSRHRSHNRSNHNTHSMWPQRGSTQPAWNCQRYPTYCFSCPFVFSKNRRWTRQSLSLVRLQCP